jgi:hypothetical protein
MACARQAATAGGARSVHAPDSVIRGRISHRQIACSQEDRQKAHKVTMESHAPIRIPQPMAGSDRLRSSHKGTLRQQTCLRCRHAWWPRTPTRTLRCPRCKSPYWDRPRRTALEVTKVPRIQDGAFVADRKAEPAASGAPISFATVLELLKRLKVEGRSWAELAEELERQCGVQLEKDQLKALIR